MTHLLASVASVEEAGTVMECGADIIDLKNPSEGALGALPLETIATITRTIANRRLVSSTIGDLPMVAATLYQAVAATAATGVDFIKIGFFPAPNWKECIAALAKLSVRYKLVAVLFADHDPDLSDLNCFAQNGFSGVMLDTANKTLGRLSDHLDRAALMAFARNTRALNLTCGLAGSLCVEDIPELLKLNPDYLGLRRALCSGQLRTSKISKENCMRVRQVFDASLQSRHLARDSLSLTDYKNPIRRLDEAFRHNE